MGLLDAVKKAFGRSSPSDQMSTQQPAAGREDAPEDATGEAMRVPEVTSGELMDELKDGAGRRLVLLDCREHFERAQTFIPDSLHIPMNSIPDRLGELEPEQELVVYCAHGNRSYGVAGWLIQQGYKARSLKGGIVDWQHQHGPVESGYRGTS